MYKQATDSGKPNNKVMVNYCRNITDTYAGYIGGQPIRYDSDEDIEDILDVLNYNDCHNEDNEFLRQALIFGVAYEIGYIDADGKQRFKVLDSRECIPVYDDTLEQNLKYIIRFYKIDLQGNTDDYFVEVYDNLMVHRYKSTAGFSSFELIEETPHYFKQVPIAVFNLNTENENIFNQIITLQDAYNELVSSETDSFQSWADAYLIMKGVSATEEELTDAKNKRAFMIDSDADVAYLTKNVSDTQVENMLTNLDEQIYKISNAPNFSDEKFMTASGVSIRYKLVGFENISANIESQMRKALQKRIELIVEVDGMLNGESLWRDINIVFTRNLPTDLTETASIVNQLRGLVSDETLLSLLEFVKDPQEEVQRVREQNEANLSMYSFASGNMKEEEEFNG